MRTVWKRLRREAAIWRTTAYLQLRGVKFGKRPVTQGHLPAIDRRVHATIEIGDRAWFRGFEARALLRADEGARLRIGDEPLINSGASIHAAVQIDIGNNFRMAALAAIADTNSHEVAPGEGVQEAPVRIGDDVWIGRGAMVLPGVSIGHGAVVGAGAVVTKDVPEHTLVVGSPARPVRSWTQPPPRLRRR
jgi:acetyltransferase-like isoleucine patch superfamily enzyme